MFPGRSVALATVLLLCTSLGRGAGINPGRPDRGSKFSPADCGDRFDFREDADHNAGSMVRGVIAIRIDPMPLGVEEYDYMNGGWAYIDAGELTLYGHGVR